MMATLTRERDLLEQAFLERLGAKLDRTEKDHWSGARTSGCGVKIVRVVRNEVAAVPVALEHSGDLVNHIGIACARHADVPFEAG